MVYSPALPLACHPATPVTREGICRKMLQRYNIQTCGNLYVEGRFQNRIEFFGDCTPSPIDLFLYIRLRQDVKAATPDFPKDPPTLTQLHNMLQTTSASHVVARLYWSILTSQLETLDRAREGWETELGGSLTDTHWTYCCQQIGGITASSRLRIIHFKFLLRMYDTLASLHRYNLRNNDKCDRCGAEGADFLHLAWSCRTISKYWEEIVRPYPRW